MRLKIAVIRREYMTKLDGVNRFVFTLADGLSELGHEVHVVSYSFEETTSSGLDAHVKNFFAVERDITIHTLTNKPEAEIWPLIALAWWNKGSGLLDKLDVDATIVNGIVPLRTKATRIVVNHGIPDVKVVGWKGFKKEVYFRIGKFLYRRYADLPVCVSYKLQKEFENSMGMRSIVVPLPIKLHLFENKVLSERNDFVVHVGTRLRKNVELSIKALRCLIKNWNVVAKLIVIGSWNDYVERLKSKYKDMIPRQLDFMFDVDIFEVRNLMAQSRALILPSTYETFSYAVLEAMASGLPVVVSEAVPAEIVQNAYNGFRVKGFEPKRYAEKLANLILDDILWKDISKNSLETAREYSHNKIAKEYERIIKRLIESVVK